MSGEGVRLTREQQALVEAALPRVRKMARMLVGRHPGASEEDLFGAGAAAAALAATRFDPGREVRFDVFCWGAVLGAMQDALPSPRIAQESLPSPRIAPEPLASPPRTPIGEHIPQDPEPDLPETTPLSPPPRRGSRQLETRIVEPEHESASSEDDDAPARPKALSLSRQDSAFFGLARAP